MLIHILEIVTLLLVLLMGLRIRKFYQLWLLAAPQPSRLQPASPASSVPETNQQKSVTSQATAVDSATESPQRSKAQPPKAEIVDNYIDGFFDD